MSARADREKKAADNREPFVAMPVRVHRDRTLSSDDFRILMEIASHDWETNEEGCRASQAMIAEACAVSATTVKRAIKRLYVAGYLLRPEPVYRGGERTGTILRLSGKVRSGRPFVAAAIDQGVARGDPPREERPVERRGFAKRFRPDVARAELTADDSGRLRLLDEWGCVDSEDMLAVLLSLIAARELQCGRPADPTRVRKLFDSAARNRRFARMAVANRPGLLLDGIERGYLLQHGPRLTVDDLPPGAQESLRALAARAAAGGVITEQTLSDYGVTRADLQRQVADIPRVDHCVTEEGEEEARICTDSNASVGSRPAIVDAVLEQLRAHVGPATFEMLTHHRTRLDVVGNTITLRAPHRFAAEIFKQKVVAQLNAFGYTATVVH